MVDELIRALASPDRATRLEAAFALGEALAGKGVRGDAEIEGLAQAVEALEALQADREAGSWARKRAKRALRKIRGAGEV